MYVEKLILFVIGMFYKCDYVLADYHIGAELTRWTKVYAKQIVNHRGDSIDELKCVTLCEDNDNRIQNHKYYLRRSVKSADISICVSENLKNKIIEYTGIQLANTFIFPCCADLKRFENLSCHHTDERIVIGYFGGLSKWQCIDELLEIFIKLQIIDKRFFLMLITNSDSSQFKKQLEKIGNENYLIKGVPFSEIPLWINKMDVSCVLRENRPLNFVSSPTKLSESLSAGVPIVVTKASGDYGDVLVNKRNGIVFDDIYFKDKDINELYEFCLDVHANRQKYFDFCRQTVKGRTWEKYSKELVDFIEDKL